MGFCSGGLRWTLLPLLVAWTPLLSYANTIKFRIHTKHSSNPLKRDNGIGKSCKIICRDSRKHTTAVHSQLIVDFFNISFFLSQFIVFFNQRLRNLATTTSITADSTQSCDCNDYQPALKMANSNIAALEQHNSEPIH